VICCYFRFLTRFIIDGFRLFDVQINVNGPDANLVYKYLKSKTGIHNIEWNFSTYFVVGPNGDVHSQSGVEPMQLKDLALDLLNEEEEF
jgi:glutathione peroxidase-family protein